MSGFMWDGEERADRNLVDDNDNSANIRRADKLRFNFGQLALPKK